MKKVIEKIIAIILILLLLMPNIFVLAVEDSEIPENNENTDDENVEDVSYDSLYKFSIENYLFKEGYDLNKDNYLSEEELLQIEELDIDNSYYDDIYDNMVILDIKKIEKLQNLKKLSISFSGLKELDFDVISNLKNLEELSLETNELESLKGWNIENLSKLEKLNTLNISTDNLKNFELLGGLNNLENLSLDTNMLETLNISNLSNLKEIDIDAYNLSNWNISNLENLNDLTLDVYSFSQENINNILGFTNLKSLDIYGYYDLENYSDDVELDLSEISNLKQLEKLYIGCSSLTDFILKPKSQMTTLKNLSITSYSLDNFEFSNIDNLNTLSISVDSLSEDTIDKIFNLPNVTNLSFYIDDIKNDSGEVVNEKTINITEKLSDLSFCLYGNIEKIKLTSKAQQTELSYLYVYARSVKDFSIENIDSLTYMYMTVDSLTKENMENIAKLKVLYNFNLSCENVTFENIDFSGLENLIYLNVQSNLMTTFDASGFEKTPYLDTITIDAEKLTEIKNLEKISNLNYLDISSDSLENLEFKSAGLEELYSILIDCNKLKNFEVSNGALPKLSSLSVYADELENFKIENDSIQNLTITSYDSENVNFQIEKLKNLETLNITSYTNNIAGIKFETLTKLESLFLYLPRMENIVLTSTELSDLTNLTVNGDNLKSLEISGFENLSSLKLNAYNLTDVSKIKYNTLPNLKKLQIDFNEVADVDISALKNLETLDVKLPNLSTLKMPEQSKIKKLELNCLNVTESVINEIYTLKELEKMNITCDNMLKFDTSIQSGEDVFFPKLEEVSIYSTTGTIENLKIADLNSLKKLKLNCSNIKNLKLANLEELIELYVDCSKLENWDTVSIEKSKKLEKMSIDCGGLTSIDLAPIGNIRNLGGLTIVLNDIENNPDVRPLNKLVNLQYLYVEYNNSSFEEVQDIILAVGLKYRGLPIFEKNLTDTQNGVLGFDFNKYGDTVTTFEERLDYSLYIKNEKMINPNIKLYNSNGERLAENDIVGTSDVLKICDGEEVKYEYTIIYYGDVNGDGKINAIDSLTIVKNKLTEEGDEDYFRFSNVAYEEAGRIITENGIPNANDGLAIVKHALDYIKIDQYK